MYDFLKIAKHFILYLLFTSNCVIGQDNTLEMGIDKLYLNGCSISGGVIKITGTGNIILNKAYFPSETTLEEIDLHFNVRIDSLSPTGDFRFGIGKIATLSGTMVEFAGNADSCTILISRMNSTTPIFVTQIPLPFVIEQGINYKFRIGKRIRNLLIEVSSIDSSSYFFNDSLSYPSPFFGSFWGTPFIGCHSGKISVTEFKLSTPFNLNPRLAVWGDSFIEGASLSDVGDRYVSLIKDSIGHSNISILGRGGENSLSISSRFSKESRWFKASKYAIIAIGVNENNFTNWKINMQKHIDSLRQHNIIPIIATLSPRSDRLTYINQVNNWIRNVYNGPYIDVNKAISQTNNYWDAGMGLSDSIHPSVNGHLSIYARIKIEAPYIFRNSEDFTIDYLNETTNENVSDTIEYSSFSNFSNSLTGSNSVASVIPGELMFFRKISTISGSNSLYSVTSVVKRPLPPTNPIVNLSMATFDWTNNPLFTNVNDYEYSMDSGITWTVCTQKPIVAQGLHSMHLRIAASVSHFKSEMIILQSPLKISDIVQLDISISPNPFNETLFFSNVTEDIMVSIYTYDSKLIRSLYLNTGSNQINTEDLNTGLYIIFVQSNSMNKTFKLMKI